MLKLRDPLGDVPAASGLERPYMHKWSASRATCWRHREAVALERRRAHLAKALWNEYGSDAKVLNVGMGVGGKMCR